MNGYGKMKRQLTSTARGLPGVATVATVAAMAAAVIMIGACGSPATITDSPHSPAPASEPAGQSSPTASEPAPPDAGTGANPGTGDDSDQAPPPQPLQIQVTTSSPTASYPCHPSGTIVVSGGDDSGDSTQVPDSAEYPLEVTYQWFIRKAGPAQNPVPIGQPGTLQFNVAGGIPISGPALDPAPDREVELRVVAPETISGGWITHPDCG